MTTPSPQRKTWNLTKCSTKQVWLVMFSFRLTRKKVVKDIEKLEFFAPKTFID